MATDSILEALESHLRHLLKCKIMPEKSYLAGDTAVYFYLKHRVSVDLDFFTPEPFNSDTLIHDLKKCFGEIHVELMEKNTLILYISKEKVKFSLFLFPYEDLKKHGTADLGGGVNCPLASLEDIEAMKAVAISQRGSAKDFVDLYTLVGRTGHRYRDIFKLVAKKYTLDNTYEYQIKTSFVYFEDAEKEAGDILMIRNNKKEKLTAEEWENIKAFFKEFIA